MTVRRQETAALGHPLTGFRWAGRLLLIGLVTIGGAAAWRCGAALDPTAIIAVIERYPATPLWFLAVHIAASLLFVPRTLLAIVAGSLFGIGWGIVLAALGSLAGAAVGFLVARYVNSGLIDLDHGARVGPILERVAGGGWRSVALLRLIPFVPHSLANYGLGLTRLPFRAYALGSLVGQLPLTVAYVEFGAAGERLLLSGVGWIEPTTIGVAALALSLLIPCIARRRAH